MPQYYVSTRSYNLGSPTPGRAQGGTLEEPTAGNLHGGVREGRELTEPRLTYTRTKLETADRAKEDLKSRRFSSTRKRLLTSTMEVKPQTETQNHFFLTITGTCWVTR